MARSLQKLDFSGHLDKDTAPEKLDPNNYTDARNVLPLTRNTESTRDHIPMLGNVSAFDLGSVAVQNKTYRLYTEDTSAVLPPEPDSTLLFYSNGVQFNDPVNGLTPYIVTWSRNQPITAQASVIKAAITVWDSSATVVEGDTYVDITLNLIAGSDYTISATDGTGTAMTFNTLYEAYDTTLAGELNAIGSYDLLGDLYVWSTTGTNLPLKTTLTVSSVALALVGARNLYQITFVENHGLTAGQSVNLLGNTLSSLDGTWIVSTTGFTPKIIVLEDYFSHTLPATPPTKITTTLYSQSIGEIGVGQYTASTDSWLYTRLGRTKQWGFRTKKQPDTYCEQTAVKSSIYWTDDFNDPRVIYYIYEYDVNGNKLPFFRTSPFFGDGIISTINSTGSYTYESILLESALQLNESGTRITFLQQLQTGGQLPSGNWRYATRFLTESLTATTTSDITNPVNVYSADTGGDATLIIGDAPETITSKINQLEITEILPGLFRYVELIGVNYVGDSIVGYNIRRESLDSTQTSITINHTGAETNTSDFDLGLLNQIFEQIATAKNITVIDKRMVLSNLTTKQKIDFSSWAQTFKHSILRKSIPAVRSAVSGTIRVGEYQDPVNVNTNMGLMHNETYRFSLKGHLKGGGFTDNFHIDDIVINCEATNIAIAGLTNPTTNDPTRRVVGLPDFDLTDGGASPAVVENVYVPYVNFSNIDFDYKINGIPIREIFDFIEIERAEVSNPTVLACGYAVPSIGLVVVNDSLPANIYSAKYVGKGEFPLISGRTLAGASLGNPLYSNSEFDIYGRERKIVAFYSPDIQFNHTSIPSFTSPNGDVMINLGNPHYVNFHNGYSPVVASFIKSNYAEYSGVLGTTSTNKPAIIPVKEATFLGYGLDHTFVSETIYRKRFRLGEGSISTANTNYTICSIRESFIMETTLEFNEIAGTGQVDGAFYYNQYYSPLSEQYGNVALSTYITCGHRMNIAASATGFQNTDVFGGDTFTQLNYLKHRSPGVFPATFPSHSPSTDGSIDGFAGGLAFYSQNRINAQMKQKSPSQTGNLYPGIPTVDWLTSPSNTDGSFGEAYQEGYTIRNQVQSDVAFNPLLEDDSDQPARIRWSAIKPQGSLSDQYRTYLPLDVHDSDQSFGEIVHHANVNGELFAWQLRAFTRKYFNTRGTLEVKGITEILIGDGSVMSRDGVTVSRYGSKHKWAIIRGKSQGGNDVFYWINTELKKALRFGYDGTVSIADIKGMQSFFANNLTWVDSQDTPADGQGIHGVWDDRYANAIWTVKGRINAAQSFGSWNSSVGYETGDKIFYISTPFSTFGDVYESIDLQTNTGNQPDLFPLKWKKLANDGTYYNEYTILFNEFKNAFICDATFTPKIYLKWTDTYLSPRPITPVDKIYQHDKGSYLTWYLNAGVSQTEKAFIEGVINQLPEETKWYEAMGVDSEIVPNRFEFATKQHQSFLTQSEFTSREDSFFSPIKKDSTTSGINSSNTTALFGKYLKAKMFFDINIYQKLSNFIVKFRVSARIKSK